MQFSVLGALRHIFSLSSAVVGAGLALGNASALAADTTIGAGQASGTVVLGAGDNLTNSGTITDSSNEAAVRAHGSAGSIINTATGSIRANGTDSSAIWIGGPATAIVNDGSIIGSAASSDDITVRVDGDLGSFVNRGSISSSNTSYDAIFLGGAVGSFVNGAGASIGGGRFGVHVMGVVDSFANAGTLTGDGGYAAFFSRVNSFANTGTIRALGNGATAVTFDNGFGTFDNNGLIVGTDRETLLIRGAAGRFNNSGTISNGGGINAAVKFENGAGSVVNSTGGTISSTANRAIEAFGQVRSFSNAGTISGAGDSAIAFAYGVETFVNEAGGTIRNTTGPGTDKGAAIAINTSQTVPQQGGGSLPVIATQSFINHGSIYGAPDQDSFGAAIVFKRLTGGNAYRVGAFENTGLISGNRFAVYFDAGVDTFRNAGTIKGAQIASVFFDQGVTDFVNDVGGVIENTAATDPNYGYAVVVDTDGDTATEIRSFTNRGTMIGVGGATVAFANQGSGTTLRVKTFSNTNTGVISGKGYGVYVAGGIDDFRNAGLIESTISDGVYIDDPMGATVTNSGTIRGVTSAVKFVGGTSNRLNLLTGSQTYGDLVFGGTGDTLDFSAFSGSAMLKTSGLENLTAGTRSFVATPGYAQVAIFDITGTSNAAIGSSFGSTLQAVNDVVGQNLRLPEGGEAEPDAYASTSRGAAADAAEEAVLTQLDTDSGAAIWGNVIGGFNVGRTTVDPSSTFGGIVAGSHARVGSVTLGGLTGYVQSNSTALSGQQTMATQVGLLGLYGTGNVGTVTIDASLVAGVGANTSKRQFVSGLALETANGNFTSAFLSPTLGVSVPVLSGEFGDLSVRTAATYVGGVTSAYTETGSSMNLSVGQQTISLLDLRLGLEGKREMVTDGGRAVTLTAKAGVSAQSNFGSSSVPVTVTNLNLGTTVATPGGTEYGVYAGFGADMAITEDLSAGVFADGSLRTDGAASGTLRLSLTGAL